MACGSPGAFQSPSKERSVPRQRLDEIHSLGVGRRGHQPRQDHQGVIQAVEGAGTQHRLILQLPETHAQQEAPAKLPLSTDEMYCGWSVRRVLRVVPVVEVAMEA